MNNLCTDPWLPVLMKDGRHATLGLLELFSRLGEIQDLVLSPKERISVMRLLICIVQRALDGPEDEEAREECREDISPKSLAYLHQWEQAFLLTGKNGGFLQVPDLACVEGGSPQPASKLDLTLASGNNSTLFDNSGGTPRTLDFSRTVLNLLAFQNHAPCGMTGVALWAGRQTGEKAPDSCPGGLCTASSALQLFLQGDNMLDTLQMNLTPRNILAANCPFGIPVWEKMPQNAYDQDAITNATRTYLGRLVPISRSIRLCGAHHDQVIVARGLEYPVYGEDKSVTWYEQSMRLNLNKEGKRVLVGADMGRAIWRSLPAMLRSFRDEDGQRRSVYENEELPEHFDIWIGALVLDKAKILGEMESCYPKQNKSFFSQETVNRLQYSLDTAAQYNSRLYSAICSYHAYLNDPFDNKKAVMSAADSRFWGILGSNEQLFIRTGEEGTPEVDKEWQTLAYKAARATYNAMCPHTTDRQLEAWAKGWKTSSKKSS